MKIQKFFFFYVFNLFFLFIFYWGIVDVQYFMFQVYHIVIHSFKYYILFTVIIKYWLSSLCYTMCAYSLFILCIVICTS